MFKQGDQVMTGIFGDTLNFKQENGPDVRLVVDGDESYARYETTDGYTVIYDPDLGLYTFAPCRIFSRPRCESRSQNKETLPAGLRGLEKGFF